MSLKSIPTTREEFTKALKIEYHYTDEAVQAELDFVDKIIAENNITDEKQIEQTYGATYLGLLGVEEIIEN